MPEFLVRSDDDFDVFMTEKDAVKLGRHVKDKLWYVPVELSMNPVDAGPVLEQVESRIRREVSQ